MASELASARDEPRARIIEAARRLFASRGLDDVTMAEIAKDAGVARATVFNYFGSKHALVEAISEDVLTFYQAMLRNALADEGTPTPVLVRALFDQMGAGIEEDRRFYRGVFREMAKVRLGLDEGSLGHRAGKQALELLLQFLARGQERGELSRAHRPEDLASGFDSLVNGTITHWLYGDASESLRERMGRAVEVFLGSVEERSAERRGVRAPRLAPPRARRLRTSRHRTKGERT